MEPPFNPDAGPDDRPCAICGAPGVVGINRRWVCLDHIDTAVGEAFAPLREALRDA